MLFGVDFQNLRPVAQCPAGFADEGEGTDETESLPVRNYASYARIYAERLEGGCKYEGDDAGARVRRDAVQDQPFDVTKALNPTTILQSASSFKPVGVMCGGILGIRKNVRPPAMVPLFDPNLSKKVFSGTRDSQFGNEAALHERLRFISKEVDDVVECLWWEISRGF